MFRPGGVVIVSDGVHTLTCDAVTCAHCQKVSERKQRPFVKGLIRDDPDDIGGVCGGCGEIICFACAGRRECRPIEKWLDQYEAAAARALIEQGRLLDSAGR